MRRVVWRILGFAFVAYVGVCLILAALQRSLIYVPRVAAELRPETSGWSPGRVHALLCVAADGTELHGWHVLPDGETERDEDTARGSLAGAPWVALYFSGNAGHRGYRVDECRLLAECGCHVALFDYRGYGENSGQPSEAALLADAEREFRFLVDDCGVPAERVILVGESLGGGVAVGLAATLCDQGTPPGGLILRSTFSSLVDAAAHHFPWLPVRWLLVDRYPSQERIPRVTCPLLAVHGDLDTIVPQALGKRLFDAAPARSRHGIEKRWRTLQGADHNDVLDVSYREFQAEVRDFVQSLDARRFAD